MKSLVVMFVVVAVAQASPRLVRRNAGQGWPAPTQAPGWGVPVGAQSSIILDAAMAAAGAGSAAEIHSGNVLVTGSGGWGGPDADLSLLSGGQTLIENDGNIVQATDQDGQTATSANVVSVGQNGIANELQAVFATGLDVSNEGNGWVGVSGNGSSSADGTSSILLQPAAATLGQPRL